MGGGAGRGVRRGGARAPDSAEHGYLRWLAAFQAYMAGETAAARAGFEEAAAIGDRWGEPDLAALSRLGVGRALIRLGQTGPGVALLDEVMVAVEAGELSPVVVGDLYCSVIEGCQELFDLRRAQQWTAVLTGWCAAQPDLVPYRGQCLLHRAELLALHGAWPDAMEEARRASARFLEPPATRRPARPPTSRPSCTGCGARPPRPRRPTAGPAAGAGSPSPAWPCSGWPRAGGGRPAAIRRVLDEAAGRPDRCRLLPAAVEIALAGGDGGRPGGGRGAGTRAAELDAPLLRAATPPRARSCWPRGTPGPRWPRCAAPGRRGGSWRRRTRRPGPGC